MRDQDDVTEAPAEQVTQTENQTPEVAVTQEAPEAPVQAPEGTEATQTPEAPTKTPEELEAEKAAAKAKAEALYEAFKTAVAQAVEARDPSTGDVPTAQVAPVKLAYAALDTHQKKAARDFLDTSMRDSLTKGLDAPKAKVYMDLAAEVKTTASQREQAVKEPVDPTQAHVEKVAAFYLALSLVPEEDGVDPSWTAKVQELSRSLAPEVKAWKDYEASRKAWATGDEKKKDDESDEAYAAREPKAPEVSPIVTNAVKIARGRGASVAKARTPKASGTASAAPRDAYTGPKRNVKRHIELVFAQHPVGTFLKTGIIAKTATDEYPEGNASSGAITAALGSPKFNLAGITPAQEGGVGGARKVA